MSRIDEVVIVNDECTNFDYVGPTEERSLRLNRARGCAQWFLDQTYHPLESMAEAWRQCCDTHVYLRCPAPDTADQAALCLRALVDEYKVHSTRERQVVDGYEMWERKKGPFWDRTTVQAGMLPQHRTIHDPEFERLHDQLLLLSRRIQTLEIGERIIKRGTVITFEQVPPPAPVTAHVLRWLETCSTNSPFHVSGNSYEMESLLARTGIGSRSVGPTSTRRPPKDLSNLARTPPKKPPGGSSSGPSRKKN